MKKRCQPKKDEETGKYLNNGQSRKAGLNRAISDSEALASLRASASWYELRRKIEYAAAKSGKVFGVVPPHHTSLECPECHHIDASNFLWRKICMWRVRVSFPLYFHHEYTVHDVKTMSQA